MGACSKGLEFTVFRFNKLMPAAGQEKEVAKFHQARPAISLILRRRGGSEAVKVIWEGR